MPKNAIIAIFIGALLGVVGFLIPSRLTAPPSPHDQRRASVPAELRVAMDTRYDGLPVEKTAFAPHGYIVVVEPPPAWAPKGNESEYFICAKPDWFPYGRFIGPPVPAVAAGIDESGYMFTTPDDIRVHRDGWVVTSDGRAFRAEALMDQMFPQFTSAQGK